MFSSIEVSASGFSLISVSSDFVETVSLLVPVLFSSVSFIFVVLSSSVLGAIFFLPGRPGLPFLTGRLLFLGARLVGGFLEASLLLVSSSRSVFFWHFVTIYRLFIFC